MSRVQAAVLCDKGTSSSTLFVTFQGTEKGTRKILKDEKKHHGTVDEFLSEQQFCKLYAITFVV